MILLTKIYFSQHSISLFSFHISLWSLSIKYREHPVTHNINRTSSIKWIVLNEKETLMNGHGLLGSTMKAFPGTNTIFLFLARSSNIPLVSSRHVTYMSIRSGKNCKRKFPSSDLYVHDDAEYIHNNSWWSIWYLNTLIHRKRPPAGTDHSQTSVGKGTESDICQIRKNYNGSEIKKMLLTGTTFQILLGRGYYGVSLLFVEESDIARVPQEAVLAPLPQQLTY